MIEKPMVTCWLNEAKQENATHLIIVLDILENDTFPIFVRVGDNVDQIYRMNTTGVLKVLEVYNMSMNLEKQYNSKRSFNL